MIDINKSYMQQKFLMHSGERKNHKYIARVKTKNSNRWRYFYSQKAYEIWKSHNKNPIDKTVVQEFYDNGDPSIRTVTKYGENGSSVERSSELLRDLQENPYKKIETRTERDANGSYERRSTYYTINKGQTFIEKILGLNKEMWKKGNTYTSSGSVARTN